MPARWGEPGRRVRRRGGVRCEEGTVAAAGDLWREPAVATEEEGGEATCGGLSGEQTTGSAYLGVRAYLRCNVAQIMHLRCDVAQSACLRHNMAQSTYLACDVVDCCHGQPWPCLGQHPGDESLVLGLPQRPAGQQVAERDLCGQCFRHQTWTWTWTWTWTSEACRQVVEWQVEKSRQVEKWESGVLLLVC